MAEKAKPKSIKDIYPKTWGAGGESPAKTMKPTPTPTPKAGSTRVGTTSPRELTPFEKALIKAKGDVTKIPGWQGGKGTE